MAGCFISFEGGEGAGKTSALAQITQKLTARGYETIVTREPGGIHISEQIREVILDRAHEEMDGRTEALLYAAARRQHLVERISPALEAGKVVLCDRFIDSSLAYQGHARGLGIDEILAINEFAIGETYPDLTLFYDVRPEVGLRRIHADGEREINRLDAEAINFHDRVYEGYKIVVGRFPDRIQTVDAEQDLDAVVSESMNIILQKLARE